MLKIDKIGFNFSFNYNIRTSPNLINDRGIGHANFNSLKMVVGCNPAFSDGAINLDISNFDIELSDLNLELKGGDLSAIINSFYKKFRNYLIAFFGNKLKSSLKSSLEVAVNSFLSDASTDMRINRKTDIFLSKKVLNATFTNEFWSFETEGLYYLSNLYDEKQSLSDGFSMPKYFPQGKDF